MNNEQIWCKTLEIIKSQLTEISFKAWFINTKLYSLKENEARIIVQYDACQKRFQQSKEYQDLIKNALCEVTNNTYILTFLLEDEINDNVKNEDVQIEKKVTIEQPSFFNFDEEYKYNSNLIEKYTFDTFEVGDSNRFTFIAAKNVAEHPSEIYNPLFLYGNSGLGKTHLMHAIGNYIVKKFNKKVLYISSEEFLDDYIKLCKKSKDNNDDYNEYFKKKYRSLDVLMIDDIQLLTKSKPTQEQFFNTFNALYNNGKQIIVSSDQSPNDIKLLEDRLKTRLEWGLTTIINPPDFELRKNILKRKVKAYQLNQINEDVIDYIASNISSDVRNLEGAINILLAESFVLGVNEITLDIAIPALKNKINKGTSEKTDILKIQRAVADYFQISVDDLKSKKRSANLTFPRQIAMYLSRTLLNENFDRIGLEFGGKDHSTVIHACNKIEKEINISEEIKKSIEKIKENI